MGPGECIADFGPGLYDQLIDELPSERLDALAQQGLAADIQDVDPAEVPDRIGGLRLMTRHALTVDHHVSCISGTHGHDRIPIRPEKTDPRTTRISCNKRATNNGFRC